MRFFLAIVSVALMALCPERGRSDPIRTCNFFETLITLPYQLEAVRRGRAGPDHFKMNLNQTLRVLKDPSRTAIFTAPELRAMRIFSGAVREDWKLNGISPNGRQIPGLTRTSSTIQNQLKKMVLKFGCEPPRSDGTASLMNVSDTPTGAVSLMVVGVIFILVSLGVIRLLWGRQEKRRICRIPALMRHGSICTITTIMNISRSGALVEVPDAGFSKTELQLHLPGRSISARIAWSNNKFAGLKFEKKLPVKYLDEIVDGEYHPDQLDAPTDAVPPCFAQGCHRACKSHHPVDRKADVRAA